jgi:glycosyltransferase involved in cell wall biosynthesis
MEVSIVVPAHNDEENILNTLSSLYKILGKTALDFQIIAVDDNSNDRTLDLMQSFTSDHVKVVHKAGRRAPSGLGSALVFGFECTTGEIVIPFMGDLSDYVLILIARIEGVNIRRNKYLRITVFICSAKSRKASASAYSTCFQSFPEQRGSCLHGRTLLF